MGKNTVSSAVVFIYMPLLDTFLKWGWWNKGKLKVKLLHTPHTSQLCPQVYCALSKNVLHREYHCSVPQVYSYFILHKWNKTVLHAAFQNSSPVYANNSLPHLYLETFHICLSVPEWALLEQDADLSDPPQWPNSSSDQRANITDRQYTVRHMGNV